jgi:hypothetical protein
MVGFLSRDGRETYEFERILRSGSQAMRERAPHCLAVHIVGSRRNSLWFGVVRRIIASRSLARLRRLHYYILYLRISQWTYEKTTTKARRDKTGRMKEIFS